MKKTLVRIVIGLLVLVVAAVIGLFLSLNSIVKKGVEAVGPQVTKVDVKVAKVNVSPMSGSGQVSGFVLGNPEGYKSPNAITVGDVQVKLQVPSVFKDVIVVEEVVIQSPEVTVEWNLGGFNLNKIKANVDATVAALAGAGGKSGAAPASSGKKFVIKNLLIKDVKISLGTTVTGTATLPKIKDIQLQNIGEAGVGVTAAELVNRVITPLFGSIIESAGSIVMNLGKGVEKMGKQGAEQINKATEGFKGLFKK